MINGLTHWGRVMLIYINKLTIIGSDNDLSPGRPQVVVWTNAGILSIRTLGKNFSETLGEIHTFSFTKMHLKISSVIWRQFCVGLNVLMHYGDWVVMRLYCTLLGWSFLGKVGSLHPHFPVIISLINVWPVFSANTASIIHLEGSLREVNDDGMDIWITETKGTWPVLWTQCDDDIHDIKYPLYENSENTFWWPMPISLYSWARCQTMRDVTYATSFLMGWNQCSRWRRPVNKMRMFLQMDAKIWTISVVIMFAVRPICIQDSIFKKSNASPGNVTQS